MPPSRLPSAAGLASILGLALALPVCTGSVHTGEASGSASGAGGHAGAGGDAGATTGSAGASGTGGRYWTIEPRPAALSADACSFVEGQTAFVHAVLSTSSSCELVGPAVASVTAPGHVAVTGFVWVEHGAVCEQIEGAEGRDVAIEGLTHGSWSVADANGPSSAKLVVDPPPPSSCTSPGPAGAGCTVDCDCLDGLLCLGFSPGCGASCRAPCDHDLDCAAGQSCTQSSPFVSNVCGTVVASTCAAPADCPPGTSCAAPAPGQPDVCDWQAILNAASRHACADESDCAPPLHCVQGDPVPGDTALRSCQLPCYTAAMRCPPAHFCNPNTSYLGETLHWVCDWVGE